MGKLPRFNDLQLRQMRSLIRKHCCNYHDGNCCTLDDGIDPSCAQWNCYSLQCTWFRDAVLPLAPDLQEKVQPVSTVCSLPTTLHSLRESSSLLPQVQPFPAAEKDP